MIDLKHLRENQALYEKGFAKKQVKVELKKLLKLDDAHRAALLEVEAMRAKRNEVSKLVPQLKDKEKEKKIAEMKKLGDELKAAEDELNKLFVQLFFPIPHLSTHFVRFLILFW